MRVLLINQFFWPDSAATSQLLTDVARDLVERGNHVEVICGGTYAKTQAEDPPDVTAHHVRGFPFGRGPATRLLSYISFYLGALSCALLSSKPDVVVTLTTPPLISVVGAILKICKGSRFCIWEMDLYPDVAVDLGYISSHGITNRLLGGIADWTRNRADTVIVLGECMRTRLAARDIDSRKIVIVENWADSSHMTAMPHNHNRDRLLLIYSGNLGLAHDVDTILRAVGLLKEDARFRFRFIGGGAHRAALSRYIATESITSVELQDYVPRNDLGVSLGAGDIGLVTQLSTCCGSVVPSKVYGLLAVGVPVLFVGPGMATPARIIHNHACGWHIENGDVEGLVSLLKHLADNPDEVAEAGANGRRALEQHFDRPIGTAHIIDQLAIALGKDNQPPMVLSTHPPHP